jgi:Fe2+ transport system protein FeoA
MIFNIDYNSCKLQGVAEVMTLDMAEPGQEYVLRGIYGGCKLRRMLLERGLTEGVKIKVIKSQPKGPIIVEFRSSRIMLDGMCARKIVVGTGQEGYFVSVESCGGKGKCNRHRAKGGWRNRGQDEEGV